MGANFSSPVVPTCSELLLQTVLVIVKSELMSAVKLLLSPPAVWKRSHLCTALRAPQLRSLLVK